MERIKCVVRCFFRSLSEKRISAFAAAAAFKFFMALPALAALLCAALPYTAFTKDEVIASAETFLPAPVYEISVFIIESAYSSSPLIFSLSAAVSVYSASSAVSTVARGLNTAMEITRRERFLRFRARGAANLIMILAAAFFYAGIAMFLAPPLKEPLVFVMLTVFIATLYSLLPSQRQRFRKELFGAALSSGALLLFTKIFVFYFTKAEPFGVFGVLGTVFAAMLWLYWCAYLFFTGACINKCVNTTCSECQKKPESGRLRG